MLGLHLGNPFFMTYDRHDQKDQVHQGKQIKGFVDVKRDSNDI